MREKEEEENEWQERLDQQELERERVLGQMQECEQQLEELMKQFEKEKEKYKGQQAATE